MRRRFFVSPGQGVVWPDDRGTDLGAGVRPIVGDVAALVADAPLYGIVAVVDAFRIGRAKERAVATEILDGVLAVA